MTDFEIPTKRLRLVPVSPKYRDEMFKEFTPEVAAFMTAQPAKDISGTDRFIADSRAKMDNGEEIVCVILHGETGEYLGNCALHDIKTLFPKLGIWIKSSAHGHHYGREAVGALKDWADEHLSYTYAKYEAATDNWPSRKIAESLGGAVMEEGTRKNSAGKEMAFVEYRIPRGAGG